MEKWKQIRRQNFTNWATLFEFLKLDQAQKTHILPSPQFPLNLPLRLAKKIAKNNLDDPILRQFLPIAQETVEVDGFVSQPLFEEEVRKGKKLLHKYEGRALLVCSSACAMNCRFCFRRNFPYAKEEKSFDAECRILEEDPSISEVILSGGDPLSLSDETLKALIDRLSAIPHLKRLRFHTRFPIGIPERLTPTFLDVLKKTRLQVYFVIHTNHINEWDKRLFAALKKIQKLGIPVLSHTVLLKGVNDSVESLKLLFESLANEGIIPYYLNQLDKVKGAAHFDVEEEKGKELMRSLATQLSGYALPKYVKEIPGKPNKTLIFF